MGRVSFKKTVVYSLLRFQGFSTLWWGSRIGSQLAFCVSVKVGGSA